MLPQVAPLQCHAFVLHSVQLRSKYAQKMRAPNNALQSSNLQFALKNAHKEAFGKVFVCFLEFSFIRT